jgi:hypothetical protein
MAQRMQDFSTIVLPIAALAACLAATGACAGDAPAPLRGDAHCQSLGDGFLAVPGSDACVRFSGYVAAGAGFDTTPRGARAPLQAPLAPVMRARAGVAFDSSMDTPMGPVRTYIEVGRPRFAP